MRIASARDTVSSLPIGSDQTNVRSGNRKAVQLLDLMLEFFADDGHWARGCYDDGKGGHCLVGALLHLSASK